MAAQAPRNLQSRWRRTVRAMGIAKIAGVARRARPRERQELPQRNNRGQQCTRPRGPGDAWLIAMALFNSSSVSLYLPRVTTRSSRMTGTDANPLNESAVARATEGSRTTAFIGLSSGTRLPSPRDQKDHELGDWHHQRHHQRGNRECNSPAPVLLKLRSGESYDRPGKYGKRSSACALHHLLSERMPRVTLLGGTARPPR